MRDTAMIVMYNSYPEKYSPRRILSKGAVGEVLGDGLLCRRLTRSAV